VEVRVGGFPAPHAGLGVIAQLGGRRRVRVQSGDREGG
jgi:hypothetical protein